MHPKNIFRILPSILLQPKLLLLLSMCLIYFFSYFQRIAVPGVCFDDIGTGFIILGTAASMSPIVLASIKEVNLSPAASTSMGIANCAVLSACAAIAAFFIRETEGAYYSSG